VGAPAPFVEPAYDIVMGITDTAALYGYVNGGLNGGTLTPDTWETKEIYQLYMSTGGDLLILSFTDETQPYTQMRIYLEGSPDVEGYLCDWNASGLDYRYIHGTSALSDWFIANNDSDVNCYLEGV
jgi:hypothetical protein